uniref:Uncharacterized protein n=1 Tax=Oryza punctata TaxID=4537 RepID=A0A0E0LSN6_ORYPU
MGSMWFPNFGGVKYKIKQFSETFSECIMGWATGKTLMNVLSVATTATSPALLGRTARTSLTWALQFGQQAHWNRIATDSGRMTQSLISLSIAITLQAGNY